MSIFLFLVFLFACSLSPVFASDFGMIINGEFEAVNSDENNTSGNVILAPWLSLPLGREGDFHFSLGLNAAFEESNLYVPELFRLEFSFKPLSRLSVRAGRFAWQDPSRFIARGRFDGADLLLDLGNVRLGAAALYTGFLYRETAYISISPGDQNDYSGDFDFNDFANTYFAPRRLISCLYGEFPGFPYMRGNLYAGLLAQFDLSGAEEPFHTQYLLLRHSLAYKAFDLILAGAVGLENTDNKGMRAAYAFTLEGGLQLPTALRDRLSLGLRWASGDGPQTAAFFPISWEAQGEVLKPALSGIMILRANYQARFLPSFSAEIGGRYFIRTDSGSFADPWLENDSYLIGAELDSSLFWAPFSDLVFSMTGGIFFPQSGEAMPDNAPLRWALKLGTIFSF